MNEIYNLYRQYLSRRKTEEKTQARELSPPGSTSMDEVDDLYRQYRQARDPDFTESISIVMRAARENIDTENAVRQIVAEASNQPTTHSYADTPRQSVFTTWFNIPGRILTSAGSLLKKACKKEWIQMGVPVCTVAAVTFSVVGYISTDQKTDGLDLAFADAANSYSTLASYINTSPTTSLGFTGEQGDALRAFDLGVNSIDLQIATLAEENILIDLSNKRLSGLLLERRDGEIISELTDLRKQLNAGYSETSKLLAEVAVSTGASQIWFDWGRDIRSVFYSAQLALEQDAVDPLRISIVEFANQFQLIDEKRFTETEIDIAQNIIAFVDRTDFTAAEFRVIRDSARDLAALRRHVGN